MSLRILSRRSLRASLAGAVSVAMFAVYAGPLAQAAAAAPENTVPPHLTEDIAIVGHQISTDDGTWDGDPTDFTYQWHVCDSDGESNCSDVGDGTHSFTPASLDDRDGATVKVTVTATDGVDYASQDSNAVDLVAPPENVLGPSIAGEPTDGHVLTAEAGTWDGTSNEAHPMDFTYRWQRCDSDGLNCDGIDHATDETYRLTPGDVGSTIKVTVTAHNGADAPADSDVTDIVAAAAPSNTGLPVISGTATAGSQLSTDNGTWAGTPTITFTYQWYRCGDSCIEVGHDEDTYDLTSGDVGHTIKVTVTAHNAAGNADATSLETAEVEAVPSNAGVPVISGSLADGETLSTTDGSWDGTPPPTFTYQWQRCDSEGDNCDPIDDATDPTYQLTPDDVGHTIVVTVTAHNAAGASDASSEATGVVVTAFAPANGHPSITGTATDGQTLTAEPGTWDGTSNEAHPMDFTY
ncbi:MAG TPA: hypothetical protein VN636_08135, partial [Acidimicrobiia bacterium]|nr:hypothetical protein [Acidimicrobiia bacterium]